MFKSPLVVGYKGEIGSFILNGLLRVMPKALNIWCFDINETEEEKLERIFRADCIFLCIPIQCTIDWLLKYKEHLKGKTIIEQTSVKSWLFDMKQSLKNLNIVSMHLLFRPSATPNKKDRVCLLFVNKHHNKEHELGEWIKQIIESNITFMDDYKEHDKVMAFQQTLLHKTILILAKIIPSYLGTTYCSSKILELAQRIKQGDKTLYDTIQNNLFKDEVFQKFQLEWHDFNINDFKFDKETINYDSKK